MLISEDIQVKIASPNMKHYKNLGYNVKNFDIITVPVEHLPPKSRQMVGVQCDFCQKIIKKSYKSYNIQKQFSITKKDCCGNCIYKKTKETHLKLYGVECTLQRKETQEKIKKSLLDKFGVENVSFSKEINKKRGKSLSENYKKNKKEVRLKTEQTNLERYGYKCPLTTEKSRQNLHKTQQKGSSQQTKIFNILKNIYGEKCVELNYIYSKLCLDILLRFDDILIDVEYDSVYWHTPQRDMKRDKFLRSRGFKIFRIKSKKNIPSKEKLLEKIEYLKNNQKEYVDIVLEDWDENLYKNKDKLGYFSEKEKIL